MGYLAALASLASSTNLSALLSTKTRGIILSICRYTLYPWSNGLLWLESDMLEWLERVMGSSQRLVGLAKYREFCYVNLRQILLKQLFQCSGLRAVGTNLEDGVLYGTDAS